MTVLVTLFVLSVCVNAEEFTETVIVQKDAPEETQSGSVTITISGKELLNDLETELKLLEKADVDLRRELDRLVVTSDTMAEELTELLEKARGLMREHPGRIEILREADSNEKGALDELRRAQELALQAGRMTQYGGLPGSGMGRMGGRGMRGMAGTGRGGFGGGGGAFFFDPFISDRYAYSEKDRKHAAELEHESRDLARQYVRVSDEAKRTELASSLKANLNELFDLKLKGYKEKMSAIERELQRLQQRVEERKKNREFIVTGRFKELVGEDNNLRW
jgi:hypothetical protein